MHPPRQGSHLFFMLAGIILLSVIFSSCQTVSPTLVSPVRNKATLDSSQTEDGKTPEPAGAKVSLPPTWTPTPTSALDYPPTRTPFPTPNYVETRAAMTAIAEGVSCKRAPDSWKIYVSPSLLTAGWCQVVGTGGTIYEYKLSAPNGWIPKTFGEIHPNLSFSTGKRNVYVRLYQAYSYRARSYEGTLADAPEKAFFCDEEEKCQGFISPHETLVRQVTETQANREMLILDSTAGDLMIRRYYQIIPFKVKKHETNRLFILEFSWLKSALDEEGYAEMLEQIDLINRTIQQR
jgi:hypothetical protein